MFSTVFLCVKEKNKNNFTCKEFVDYPEADKYFNDTYFNTGIGCQSTMLPVCKFMPEIVRRHVLQYKLANIFNRVSIV
jgi:hypothetical protein